MRGRIRPRSVILGALIGLALCAVTPYNNAYLNATPLAGGHFPLAPFFVLVWLTVIVATVSRVLKAPPMLTGLELLTTWILSVIVSGMAFTGLARTFFINLTAPQYFANVGNRWKEVLGPLVPDGLTPSDPQAVELLYNGMPDAPRGTWDMIQAIPWSAWTGPLVNWGIFILLCYFIMLCLVNLFSRQWVVNERINFPLIRLPQVMEELFDQGRFSDFLTNRFLIIGLLVSVSLHLLNGLNFYYPSVPSLPTLILAGKFFPKTGLFSGFYKMKIYLYPAFIGFAFLTSRQISFSLWFFYIAGCVLYGIFSMLGVTIPASALGVTFGPTLTRPEETQMLGAYGVFFVFILWLARRHIAQVFKETFSLKPGSESEAEWVAAKWSMWGLIIGSALLVAWCLFFGMPLLTSVLVLGAFFMVMLVATKVICQGGIAYFTLTAAPTDGILAIFGSKFIAPASLALTAMAQKVLFVDLRESLMPSLLHGAKVTEWIKNKRLMLGGIIFVLLAGVAVSFVSMLMICYRHGVRELSLDWATQTSMNVYTNVQRLIEAPAPTNEWVVIFAIMGAVIMGVLVLCYQRFPWWPIHPIGYLAAYSSAMRILWFSFFLGWLCNQLSLRYGGVVLFKRIRFLFFGFILGDFLMGGAWAVYGLYAGQSYQVLPN